MTIMTAVQGTEATTEESNPRDDAPYPVASVPSENTILNSQLTTPPGASWERSDWRLDGTPLEELELSYPGFTALANARPRWNHLSSRVLVNGNQNTTAKLQRQLWLGEIKDPRLLHGAMHFYAVRKNLARSTFELKLAQHMREIAVTAAGYGPMRPLAQSQLSLFAAIIAAVADATALRERALVEGEKVSPELRDEISRVIGKHYGVVTAAIVPLHGGSNLSPSAFMRLIAAPSTALTADDWDMLRALPRRDELPSLMMHGREQIARLALSQIRLVVSNGQNGSGNRTQVREALQDEMNRFSIKERSVMKDAAKLLFKSDHSNDGKGAPSSLALELELFTPGALLSFMEMVQEYNEEWAVAAMDWGAGSDVVEEAEGETEEEKS